MLLLAAALGAIGVWGASRSTLDPDLARLLPSWYPSVQRLESLRDRFGGIGYVGLLVEGGTAETRRAFADAVSPRLQALPAVQHVESQRPSDFFADRFLWYLDRADLEAVRDRLRERQRWQIERSFLDLDDEPPPPVDLSDIEARYRQRYGAQIGGERSRYYEDPAGQKLVVLVRPSDLASDLDFAKAVVAQIEGAVRETDPARWGVSVELTGRYKKRVDLQAVLSRDMALTSAVAAVLIIAYVAFHFRRVGAVALLMAPLLLGVSLTYGVAALGFGRLNVLTAFVGAILGGIGIDHGIHLLGRFDEERHRGRDAEAAVAVAFGEAGRVSVAAALTSAAAFACLTWTDFRAFREFGALSALGLLLVLGSYLLMLPPMLALAMRLPWRRSRPPRALALPGVAHMLRRAPALSGLLMLAAVVAATGIPRLRFDADLARLDDADTPSFRRGAEVSAILGRSQTPMAVLAPSEERAREAADVVRARMKQLGPEATVGSVATLSDFLPADQEDKAPTIRQIRAIVSRLDAATLDGPTRDRLSQLQRAADTTPFGLDDLPASVRQLFATKPGAQPVHLVLLFPTVSTSEAHAVRRLAAQVRDIPLPSGGMLAGAGEPLVLADILETVQRDAPRIMALTLFLVLAVLWATLGRMRLAAIAVLPAVITLAVTLGLMPRLGLELNYLNMIIVPILVGIGVDDGAHVLMRVYAGEPLERVWRHTGWDITGAILTDIFGFGALALAGHRGLAAVGQLALLGLGVSLFVCVVLLPAALAALPLLGGGSSPVTPAGGPERRGRA